MVPAGLAGHNRGCSLLAAIAVEEHIAVAVAVAVDDDDGVAAADVVVVVGEVAEIGGSRDLVEDWHMTAKLGLLPLGGEDQCRWMLAEAP